MSRSVTVRLKIILSGVASESTVKYPSRSNWKESPGFADCNPFSSMQFLRTFRDSLFTNSVIIRAMDIPLVMLTNVPLVMKIPMELVYKVQVVLMLIQKN